MEFEQITLKKEEMELLRKLDSEGPALVEPENRAALTRLKHFEFVEFWPVTNPAAFDEARRLSGDVIPKAASVTDAGRDYLAWADSREAQERRDFRREILLLLAGALIALLTERVPGLLSALLRLLQSLIQRG